MIQLNPNFNVCRLWKHLFIHIFVTGFIYSIYTLHIWKLIYICLHSNICMLIHCSAVNWLCYQCKFKKESHQIARCIQQKKNIFLAKTTSISNLEENEWIKQYLAQDIQTDAKLSMPLNYQISFQDLLSIFILIFDSWWRSGKKNWYTKKAYQINQEMCRMNVKSDSRQWYKKKELNSNKWQIQMNFHFFLCSTVLRFTFHCNCTKQWFIYPFYKDWIWNSTYIQCLNIRTKCVMRTQKKSRNKSRKKRQNRSTLKLGKLDTEKKLLDTIDVVEIRLMAVFCLNIQYK